MAVLLKTTLVRVSSIQIMQVRVQNKDKILWKSTYIGDVSSIVLSGSTGPWRLLIFLIDKVDGRGDALLGWHAWKRWMCYRLCLSPPCIARPMHNIAGWQETGEEMAGNGGVFIKRHQLMET